MTEQWVDHFRVLQVHQLAEQDVIEGAYKKLCMKYHPDRNPMPEAEDRMKQINLAYEILGDATRRSAYYRDWQRHNITPPRATATAAPSARNNVIGHPEARRNIAAYFDALSKSAYPQAYELLSQADRQYVSLASFTQWQQSVAESYTIRSFQVRQCKHFDDLLVEGSVSRTAQRFTIDINEEDKRAKTETTYAFQKFMINEDGHWLVYLGYRDLPAIVSQFRHAANTKEEAALMNDWEHYKSITDLQHGMSNYAGLLERAEPELYRYKRYGRGFSVAVVRVEVLRTRAPGMEERVIRYAGYSLKKQIRITDAIGFLKNESFGLLLPETAHRNTRAALRRLTQHVARDVWACFDTKVRLRTATCDYSGEDFKRTLQRLCEQAGMAEYERKTGI